MFPFLMQYWAGNPVKFIHDVTPEEREYMIKHVKRLYEEAKEHEKEHFKSEEERARERAEKPFESPHGPAWVPK
jgi:hypothetical protein